jgi:periplasmic divalent cation tolerance protein
MKRSSTFAIALVTAPDLKTARALSKAALKKSLVACANIIPKIESHYWWQGKLESGTEVLIIFKTTRAQLKPLEKLILAEHPYDTAEFIVLGIERGAKRYLQWIESSTT